VSFPCRGRIVWVEITDPQGENPKCRPAVIITPTEAIRPDEPDCEVWVLGVTTRTEDTSAELAVELPWAPDRRHPKTGLSERCAVVCNWWKRIRLGSIREYAGVVPGRQLLEILGKVKTLLE